MPAPKTLAELATVLNLTEEKTKSVLFNVVDFLISNPLQDEAIENGMYELPANVGETSFVKAYGEALWASYELAVGEMPEKKMWVSVGFNGLKTTVGRPYSQ